MAKSASLWKKGRGKLGPLDPLIGTWSATSDSPMGKVQCSRTFTPVLNGTYVQLEAEWKFGKGAYKELAVYGPGPDGTLSFWSFTSDGKRSEGKLADGTDIHPEAVCFEAQMPAGLARMVYWPNDEGGINWAVESKNKKGWKRFTEHHYKKL
ncbi:MAG: hypothetical protein IPH75_00975 [bacterium]|nr:hypothetical protein [bacterium]